jgi:hypothetical protein
MYKPILGYWITYVDGLQKYVLKKLTLWKYSHATQVPNATHTQYSAAEKAIVMCPTG